MNRREDLQRETLTALFRHSFEPGRRGTQRRGETDPSLATKLPLGEVQSVESTSHFLPEKFSLSGANNSSQEGAL